MVYIQTDCEPDSRASPAVAVFCVALHVGVTDELSGAPRWPAALVRRDRSARVRFRDLPVPGLRGDDQLGRPVAELCRAVRLLLVHFGGTSLARRTRRRTTGWPAARDLQRSDEPFKLTRRDCCELAPVDQAAARVRIGSGSAAAPTFVTADLPIWPAGADLRAQRVQAVYNGRVTANRARRAHRGLSLATVSRHVDQTTLSIAYVMCSNAFMLRVPRRRRLLAV